jgi:hypothetical protein
MLLRDFGPCGTIFMTVFITTVHLAVILNGLFTSKKVIRLLTPIICAEVKNE